MNPLILSALFLSLYAQGLSAYFYITGAVGIRTTALTAIFQAGSLVLALLFSLQIRECRQKLKQFKLVDFFLLMFFVAVLLDIQFTSVPKQIPPDLLFKFIVYMFALFVARCLTKAQFKWVFQITAALSIVTSILLFRDFLSGSAVAVNNASRLAIGDSANPIEAGNLGAFAALVSLLISLKAKNFVTKLTFLGLAAPGVAVASLSGTRSAVLAFGVGAVFLVGTTLLFQLKNLGARLRQFSLSSFFYYGLVSLGLIVGLMFTPASSVASNSGGAKTDGFVLERTLARLTTTSDQSTAGRFAYYNAALEGFTKNPILGGQVYSVGFVHNAFLQVLVELGIFGFVTYIAPVIWLIWRFISIVRSGLKRTSSYFSTDDWTITAFMAIILIQALLVLMVHAEPYRSYFPPCAIGMLIAFSRLGLEKLPSRSQAVSRTQAL